MPITVEDARGGSTVNQTGPVVAVPSAVADDLMLVFVEADAAGPLSTPAGWTRVRVDRGGDTGDVNPTYAYVFARVLTDTEPSSYQFPAQDPSTNHAWVVASVLLRGADPDTPINVSSGDGGNDAPMTAPGVTTTSAGCLLLAAFTCYAAVTPPDGMTELVEQSSTTNVHVEVASEDLGTSVGATGDRVSPSGTVMWTAQLVAIQPLATPPAQPTITAPSNGGYVDTSTGLTVSHQVHSTDGAAINAYALRLKTVGATQYSYWNAGTSSWQSTPVWNPCSVPDGGTLTVAIPASATIAVGSAYNLSVADQEAGAQLQGPFAPDVQFTAQPGPTLVVTGPADPVTTTTRPTVTWTTTPAPGAQQTDWQVIVETGQYGATPGSGTAVTDSGVTPGTQQAWTLDTDLVNATRYRAFVRATQTGGQQTLWGIVDWTEQLTPPTVPALVATPRTDLTTNAPQVSLAITGADTGPDWDHTNTAFTVEFSDDQQTWTGLRGGVGTPASDDTATVVDHWVVPGRVRWYRARTIGTTGAQTIASANSPAVPALATTDSWWLLDATDPASAIPVEVAEQTAFTESRDKAVHLPLDDPTEDGPTLPIVVHGAQRGMQASYTLRTRTRAGREALLDLIARDTVCYLLTTPDADGEAGDGWYVDIDATAINRVVQGKFPHRSIAVDVVQVAAP
ncbi:MAG TPA: hypothetical protein VFJ19_09305 [Nocardioidaceae bacterium]|nr:hypothetical protein [Nocardioidaceae bacterium]